MSGQERMDAPPTNGDRITLSEFTHLLTLIKADLAAMETRILGRLTENATGAAERWQLHDKNEERILADWDKRFALLEGRVDKHLEAEERDHVAWDARINPVRNTLKLIAAHWKTIAIVVWAMIGTFAILADLLARYFGEHIT